MVSYLRLTKAYVYWLPGKVGETQLLAHSHTSDV